jgi:hypothetical protein
VTPPSDGADGAVDATFAADAAGIAVVPHVPCGETGLPLTAYAKDPVSPLVAGLIADIQSLLADGLPGLMVPPSVVVVSDRRQLP